MKKARYTYWTLRNRESFASMMMQNERKYLMRRDSFGRWTSVFLTKGMYGNVQNVKDEIFEKNVRLGNWVKASPKLSRRAGQLNKKSN